MRFLSLCSGIEAASLAFTPLGWQPVAFAETGAFCRAVLAHRFPQVTNRGDMTKYERWPDDDAIDLVCGGTPCPSFSTAGLRGGLSDPRGDLSLVFAGVVARYRPRWVLWENVPGILFTNEGRDLGTFLGLLAHLGYGFAFRVLDAQYFGLAQRRRRVYVVGHLGDWHCAAAVLFDAAGLRGDPAPRREARKGSAPVVAACLDAGYGRLQGASGQDADHGHSHLVVTEQAFEVANVLTKRTHKGLNTTLDEGQTPILVAPSPAFDQAETSVAFPAYLSATQRLATTDLAPSLQAVNPMAVTAGTRVRRLIPRECERLQGLPDDWTLVPYRGRLARDLPRYQAIGNAWPVPVVRWIGQRMARVSALVPAVACSDAPADLQTSPTDDYRKKAQENTAKKAAEKWSFSEGKGTSGRLFLRIPYKGIE